MQEASKVEHRLSVRRMCEVCFEEGTLGIDGIACAAVEPVVLDALVEEIPQPQQPCAHFVCNDCFSALVRAQSEPEIGAMPENPDGSILCPGRCRHDPARRCGAQPFT